MIRPSDRDRLDDAAAAVLAAADPTLAALLAAERDHQDGRLDLVASENYGSAAQRAACGSLLMDVTVEGPVGQRFLGTSAAVDAIEQLAIDRACALFGARHALVQPHSGTQANQAALLALARPGDTLLAMRLDAGGHFSHGGEASLAGRLFRPVFYGLTASGDEIDHDEVDRLARQHRPSVIIAGGSAFPGSIDFARLAATADAVGAALLADIAHVAGLVACGLFPDPVPHAAAVTTTTGKNLGGAHGGLILTRDSGIARRIEAALCPVVQGTPLVNLIAAKAVALAEAATPAFAARQRQVLRNARALAETLEARGLPRIGRAIATPLVLLDLRRQPVGAARLAACLDRCGIGSTAVPLTGDADFASASGLRLGVSALTTRGLDAAAFERIGSLIADAVEADAPADGPVAHRIRDAVRDLTRRFPLHARH